MLRGVYNNGGVDYQLTGTVPLYQGCPVWARGFAVWWAVDYFQKSGHSQLENTSTKITMVPLTLGMKYIMPFEMWRPYLGLAMKYWFVNVHNHSPYVINHTRKNGMGGVAEAGLLVFLSNHWALDIFTSYSFKKFGPPHNPPPYIETTSLQVGGWNFGGGIGFKW